MSRWGCLGEVRWGSVGLGGASKNRTCDLSIISAAPPRNGTHDDTPVPGHRRCRATWHNHAHGDPRPSRALCCNVIEFMTGHIAQPSSCTQILVDTKRPIPRGYRPPSDRVIVFCQASNSRRAGCLRPEVNPWAKRGFF